VGEPIEARTGAGEIDHLLGPKNIGRPRDGQRRSEIDVPGAMNDLRYRFGKRLVFIYGDAHTWSPDVAGYQPDTIGSER
jgi:hypothetical protein